MSLQRQPFPGRAQLGAGGAPALVGGGEPRGGPEGPTRAPGWLILLLGLRRSSEELQSSLNSPRRFWPLSVQSAPHGHPGSIGSGLCPSVCASLRPLCPGHHTAPCQGSLVLPAHGPLLTPLCRACLEGRVRGRVGGSAPGEGPRGGLSSGGTGPGLSLLSPQSSWGWRRV